MERFSMRKQLTMSRASRINSEIGSPTKVNILHTHSKSTDSTPTTITLSQSEQLQLSEKLETIFKFLQESREEIVNSTSILVQTLNQLSKTALNISLEYEFKLKAIQNSAKKERPIKLEDLSEISNFYIPGKLNKLNIDGVLREMQKVFDIKTEDLGKADFHNNSNQLLCSKDYFEGLVRIDLKTFQVSPLNFAPKVFPYSNICRVTENQIFVNGGYNGTESVPDTYIIDIQSKSYETLPNSIKRDAAGIVYKDRKVFVFGGIEKKGVDLDACESFDIDKYEWSRLTPLPRVSKANTATLLGNRIVVLGFNLEYLLEYQESGFRELIKLPGDCMKFVFENWIVTPDELLENTGNGFKWTRYCFPNSLKFGWLFTFSGTRSGKYIYFIDDVNGLLRIDTSEKKIDRIL